jgi:ATP-binding cassette subfamily B protein/ATP-binding cassette subfamily C protein
VTGTVIKRKGTPRHRGGVQPADQSLDQGKLAAAVTEAGAAEVIGGLADGYDTLLDRRFEGGHDLSGEQTVLLITHRLASVRYADRIYVLRHGELAEQGTHAELMRLGGRYAQLNCRRARTVRRGR